MLSAFCSGTSYSINITFFETDLSLRRKKITKSFSSECMVNKVEKKLSLVWGKKLEVLSRMLTPEIKTANIVYSFLLQASLLAFDLS